MKPFALSMSKGERPRARLALFALAALAAGCGASTEKPGFRFSRPSAVAVFRAALDVPGSIPPVPGPLAPYIAIADAGTDELRLIGANDDVVVSSPVRFYPLSVSTDPRPARLAVATLPVETPDDLPAGGLPHPELRLPDALVVVPDGTAKLQLVDTWSGIPLVVGEIDLAVPAGGPVSVLAINSVPVAAGQARFVVALSGGRIAFVDVARAPPASLMTTDVLAARPITFAAAGSWPCSSPGSCVSPSVGFDARDLAVSPDGKTLYVATEDLITDSVTAGSGLGVAELDLTAVDPAASVRLIKVDAPGAAQGVPTVAVAAFDVAERDPNDLGVPVPPLDAKGNAMSAPLQVEGFGSAALQNLYAAVDPASCGIDKPIACGIVVLDRVSRTRRLDPAGETCGSGTCPMAPMPIPGVPLAILPTRPPAVGDQQQPTPAAASGQPAQLQLQRISPGTGQTWTESVAAVPSSDGRVYLVDLSRWYTPSDRSYLRSTTRTRASAASTIQAADPTKTTATYGWTVGLKPLNPDDTVVTQDVVTQPESLVKRVAVTPGYTPTEKWSVTYQGALPGLAHRAAQIWKSGGAVYLAVQVQRSDGTQRDVANVFDPRLGIHADVVAGDIAAIYPSGTTCMPAAPDGSDPNPYVDASIVGLVVPLKDDHPGGALQLAADPCDRPGATALVDGGGRVEITVSIRASGFVITGAALGYVDRIAFDTAQNAGRFEWLVGVPGQDETSLEPVCPLATWPSDPSDPVFASCVADPSCRSNCEALFKARKARRLFYIGDKCPDPTVSWPANCDVDGKNCDTSDPCTKYWPSVDTTMKPTPVYFYDFPQPFTQVPMLAFRIAAPLDQDTGQQPGVKDQFFVRDSVLKIDTDSGMLATSRRPLASGSAIGAALPTGISLFDRSLAPGHANDGVRFLVSYVDNLVLDFSPGQGIGDVTVLR